MINVVCPSFLDVGVRIVHILLMSYAGEQARNDFRCGNEQSSERDNGVWDDVDDRDWDGDGDGFAPDLTKCYD